MKLKLDDDQISDNFFDHTRILGIASTLKNYQLCFQIEKQLQVDFRTSQDLQIPLEKNKRTYSFTVYEFLEPAIATEHFLYTNKNDGEALLPELQHLDFIWLLKGVFFNNDEVFKDLQQNLRTIQGIQLVTEVAHEKIKSRDNLQL
jgi:hypothetical protein